MWGAISFLVTLSWCFSYVNLIQTTETSSSNLDDSNFLYEDEYIHETRHGVCRPSRKDLDGCKYFTVQTVVLYLVN